MKEKPNQHEPEKELRRANRNGETAAFSQRNTRKFFQTRGANHAVIVFRDAFAAKKLPALRAACDGFALKMIEATLVGEGLHRNNQIIRGGAFGSS